MRKFQDLTEGDLFIIYKQLFEEGMLLYVKCFPMTRHNKEINALSVFTADTAYIDEDVPVVKVFK